MLACHLGSRGRSLCLGEFRRDMLRWKVRKFQSSQSRLEQAGVLVTSALPAWAAALFILITPLADKTWPEVPPERMAWGRKCTSQPARELDGAWEAKSMRKGDRVPLLMPVPITEGIRDRQLFKPAPLGKSGQQGGQLVSPLPLQVPQGSWGET